MQNTNLLRITKLFENCPLIIMPIVDQLVREKKKWERETLNISDDQMIQSQRWVKRAGLKAGSGVLPVSSCLITNFLPMSCLVSFICYIS